MDAYELSNPLHPEPGKKHVNFGLNPKAWARSLREIADQVERGDIIPVKAICYSTADKEDFTVSALVLKFVEKREMMVREVEAKLDGKHVFRTLHGPSNGVTPNFPIAKVQVK
jgi:hypothetical protein